MLQLMGICTDLRVTVDKYGSSPYNYHLLRRLYHKVQHRPAMMVRDVLITLKGLEEDDR